MSVSWHEDDEDFKLGGRAGLKSKPRFSFTELKMLLNAVKKNRYTILKKFNHGVSAEAKKLTWAKITDQINALGENHREVRQIMKKWADLKCDGKRRIVALRGPNGKNVRKKRLGPVEQMVHKILMMSPHGGGESDTEFGQEDDLSKLYGAGGLSAESEPLSFASMTDGSFSVDLSPPSSPGKERAGEFQSSDYEMPDDGAEPVLDFDDDDDSLFSSSCPDQTVGQRRRLPAADLSADGVAPRIKLLHTYSRANSQQPSSSSSKAPSGPSSSSPPTSPKPSNGIPSSTSDGRQPSTPPPPRSSSSSSKSDPLPSASGGRQSLGQVAQQSLQLQAASRTLLAGVSRSLETLAQSVQQLVETQQEFSHESLLLQREALAVLRDFSSSALAVLRDKGGGGPAPPRQQVTPRF